MLRALNSVGRQLLLSSLGQSECGEGRLCCWILAVLTDYLSGTGLGCRRGAGPCSRDLSRETEDVEEAIFSGRWSGSVTQSDDVFSEIVPEEQRPLVQG